MRSLTVSFFAASLLAVFSPGPASAQPGVYDPNHHTLFHLPMNGPNAGVPENCSINNASLLSYVADRFGISAGATKVAALGSYLDNFYLACSDTQIAGSPNPSFTLGYWVQISDFPNDGANCTLGCDYRMFTILAANSDNSGCDKYLAMNIGVGGGGDPNACQGGLNGDVGQFTAATSVIDGTWHSLIWVFDHTNQVITFYLDGVQNGTAALPDPPYIAENTQYIAGAENGAFAFNGNLDDVWMEDYAWTAGDVARYYYGLSNTIDVSESAGNPTSAFLTQLQQAGITNVVVKAPQPCGTTDCQDAVEIAGEQFNAFLGGGFQVAAYCYLHFRTTSATGAQQAQNCIASIPPADLTSIRFIALDVEEEKQPTSPSTAITIISAAAAAIAGAPPTGIGKPVVIYTSPALWNTITGDTTQFNSYPLWTTGGQFQDGGQVYCGNGVPNLLPFPSQFGGWTARSGKQYNYGPRSPTGCSGGSLFGVALDLDVFAPSLFK